MARTLVSGQNIPFYADNLVSVTKDAVYKNGVIFMPAETGDVTGVAILDYKDAIALGVDPDTYAKTLPEQQAGVFCPVIFAKILSDTTIDGLICDIAGQYKK